MISPHRHANQSRGIHVRRQIGHIDTVSLILDLQNVVADIKVGIR